MILAVTVNFDRFIRDLQAGDPVVWAIVAGTLLFTGFSMYRKYRTFTTAPRSTIEDE
jgi:hypothetical protein